MSDRTAMCSHRSLCSSFVCGYLLILILDHLIFERRRLRAKTNGLNAMRARAFAGIKPKGTNKVTKATKPNGTGTIKQRGGIKKKGEPMPLSWEAQHICKLVKYSAHTGNVRSYLMGAVDTPKVRSRAAYGSLILCFCPCSFPAGDGLVTCERDALAKDKSLKRVGI